MPQQFRNNPNHLMGEQVVLGIPQQSTLGVLGEPQGMSHITNVLAQNAQLLTNANVNQQLAAAGVNK